MKKKIHKVKQKETPKILVEWLYLTAGAPALRRLYGYLQEKKDREAQLWEEAGVLEIGLPGAALWMWSFFRRRNGMKSWRHMQ